MAIEAILFDLGRVLVDLDLDLVLRQLTARCPDPSRFERAFLDAGLAYRYESGAITTQEFYDHLCRTGGLQVELEEFRNIWNSIFRPGLLVSEDLLANLRRIYPLILVSNTNEVHVEFIAQRYSVLEYFTHKVLSFEVKSMKPEARIFEHAIAVSGKKPESLFFVDDRAENVEGARALGIQSHQFKSERELVAALLAAGVEVSEFNGDHNNSNGEK